MYGSAYHQTYSNSFASLYMSGPPPSRLGFQAKMEMPAHINIMFRARPPLQFIKPIDRNRCRRLDAILDERRDYEVLFEQPDDEEKKDKSIESKEQVREKKWVENLKKNLKENQKKIRDWKPEQDQKATSDPYRTLFVARLPQNLDEQKLKEHFLKYGPIDDVRIIKFLNKKQEEKSKKYGFIMFRHHNDFKGKTKQIPDAYKYGHGLKINDKRIIVDYERGRTCENWMPRRLGGTLGGESRKCPKTEAMLRKLKRELTPDPERHRVKERERSRDQQRYQEKKRDEKKSHRHQQVKSVEKEEEANGKQERHRHHRHHKHHKDHKDHKDRKEKRRSDKHRGRDETKGLSPEQGEIKEDA